MLNYNEIKERKYIIHEDAPWEVIASQVSRKQANKPVNKTKLKNLITGQTIDHTFHVSDKVNEADMGTKEIKYLYKKEGRGDAPDEYWFSEPDNPRERFMLDENLVGDMPKYIKENSKVSVLTFKDEPVSVKLPMKVELKVTEAPPAVKGNTATGGDKVVTLETGLAVTTPLFINPGDVISVKTSDGSYSERIEKA